MSKRFEVITGHQSGGTPIVEVVEAAKCNIMASGILVFSDYGNVTTKIFGSQGWLQMTPLGEVEGRDIELAN